MQVVGTGKRFDSPDHAAQYWSSVLEAVRGVPGVADAALSSQLPLSGLFDAYGVSFESAPQVAVNESGALRYVVTPGWFRTMGIPLLRGRLLGVRDRPPEAVVISESLARRYFGQEDPIGQRVRFGVLSPKRRAIERVQAGPVSLGTSSARVGWPGPGSPEVKGPRVQVTTYSQHTRTIAALGAFATVVLVVCFASTSVAWPPQRRPAESQSGDEARSENWPRFRGPLSIPVSNDPGLPERWSTTENVEWVAEVPGVGWSSPVVWGGKVFLTTATSQQSMKQPSLGTDFSNEYIAELRAEGLSSEEINERLYTRDREMPHEIVIGLMVYCYDLETGKRLWEQQIYRGRPLGGRHRKNSFASETPVTDGDRVYVYFTHHGLYAYSFEGRRVWAAPLEPHQTSRDFGTGASPALYKDRLFVLNDNEDQGFLAAFDTRTGKELWRKPRTIEARRKTGWATPFVWENDQRTEVVTSGPGVIISYDLDGNELWHMRRMAGSAIQTPFAWHGLLYVTSGSSGGHNKPLAAIRPGGSGDITPPEGEDKSDYVVWYNRLAGGTYLPTPLIYDGALYVLTEKGIFARYDPKTGERVYRSRVAPGAAAFTASPWAYNGKIFALGEEGSTYVIEHGDSYRLLGVNALEEWAMASPAIVEDRLLIRTQSRLYSIRNRDRENDQPRQ